MCVVRAAGSWLGACNRVWVEETGLATGTTGEGAALAWPGRCSAGLGRGRRSARCQRGPCITGWPERRIPISTAHYPGERLVFFIALSSGCNLLVLQFQWLKRQFSSRQFTVKGFFFFFSFFCVFSWQDFFFCVKLLTECTRQIIVITF